jgi:hypothetical protein
VENFWVGRKRGLMMAPQVIPTFRVAQGKEEKMESGTKREKSGTGIIRSKSKFLERGNARCHR